MTDSKLEIYVEKVLPADRRAELMKSLPSYIKPEVFERNLINALMANPKLLNYDPRLVYREVSKAAAIGVLLDPILGEAYLATPGHSVQLRIGYKGLMKLARISLGGARIYAKEVCEHDYYKATYGAHKDLVHEIASFKPRGEVIGYYAVITYKDGEFDFEEMSLDEIYKIRDRSAVSTAWKTDEGEMCKKTPIRRLMKRQPQSTELAQAFAVEDQAEFPQFERRGPGRPPKPFEERVIEHTPQSTSRVPEDNLPPPPPDDDFPGDAHTAEDVTERDDAAIVEGER